MEDKTSPNNLYTLVNVNKEEEDDTISMKKMKLCYANNILL
jgi:hypothetical protein